MADREKVIKSLEICSTGHCEISCPFHNAPQCTRAILSDAIELLKEREAVEPIPFFTETGAEVQNYVICGHCKSIKTIMSKYTKQKYCHECGFPVLWKGR